MSAVIRYYCMELFLQIQRLLEKETHIIKDVYPYKTYDPEVQICLIPAFSDNYSYLIISGNSAIVIDPADGKKIEKEITKRDLKIRAIIVTHDHIDHIRGVPYLIKKYNVDVYAAPSAFLPIKKKINVTDKEVLSINNIDIEIISSPGHKVSIDSEGNENSNILIYLKKAKVLFTGDTLFPCGCGCFDYNQTPLMFESLKKIRNLPEDVNIYAGHEYSIKNAKFAYSIYGKNLLLKNRLKEIEEKLNRSIPVMPTTLKMEKEINPFLKWDDVNLKKLLNVSEKNDIEALWYIRKKKNDFNE